MGGSREYFQWSYCNLSGDGVGNIIGRFSFILTRCPQKTGSEDNWKSRLGSIIIAVHNFMSYGELLKKGRYISRYGMEQNGTELEFVFCTQCYPSHVFSHGICIWCSVTYKCMLHMKFQVAVSGKLAGKGFWRWTMCSIQRKFLSVTWLLQKTLV